MPEFRNDPTLPAPLFPGTHMVLDGRYVFLSGLTAVDIQGGETVLGNIEGETRLVLRRIRRMLASVGSGMDQVVRVDVHITEMEEIRRMDAVYAEFFDACRYPARTCTQSPRLYGGARVEITVMAQRPESEEGSILASESNPTDNASG